MSGMRSRFIGAVKNNPSLILYDKVGKKKFCQRGERKLDFGVITLS